ncbi:MAG: glycine oxidase ThiO [Acidobacteria bacterium]|nr:MAG: glycine oxidase ThiO [Acidobacteriota bacterium]
MDSDVLIIGGGVIGLSIARDLHKKRAGKITIVDRGGIGREASWAAAGMLAPNIETDSDSTFHEFGTESLELYPGFAAALLDETGVDIELDRSGTLCLAFNKEEETGLRETYERQQNRNVSVEFLSSEELRRLEPAISETTTSALFYPNDWQVENRKLVGALREFAKRNGIETIENAEVEELLTEQQRVVGARTNARDFRADTTVLATGAWTSLIKIGDTTMPVSIKPIRGQMLSFDLRERPLRHVVYSHRGYLVPRADGRVLVGATAEDAGFENRTTAEGIAGLTDAAVEIMPQLSEAQVAETWSGLRPFAADGLPILGKIPGWQNVVIATAHYRNGILLAPKTAELIAENIIDGASSEYLQRFSVERFANAATARTNI